MLHRAIRATLEAEARRRAELESEVARPADPGRLRALLVEMGRLAKRQERFAEFLACERAAAETAKLAQSEPDAEMRALALEEQQSIISL